MKKTMIANRPMSYGTRRLRAGDEFSAPRRDADLLARLGRATYAAKGAEPAPAEKPGAEDMTELRRQYFEAVGKRPFNGWDADTLKAKMAAAKG